MADTKLDWLCGLAGSSAVHISSMKERTRDRFAVMMYTDKVLRLYPVQKEYARATSSQASRDLSKLGRSTTEAQRVRAGGGWDRVQQLVLKMLIS